ncbi:MAG TPA: tRNA (adenosine(37)-N6)-dimethylallyltransferase MiaA [Planctomycetota bacterium]
MTPVFLLGPTASGKHVTAILLAQRLGAEIISVDSMKVYRGMDIGTAKPGREERASAPHHLIDICDPSETYSAGRFVRDAAEARRGIEARGKRALFVGGTSLYYKAYRYGLFEGPPADPVLRDELIAEGPAALHAELSRVDPAAAKRIHPNDLKRLVRAVEVFRKTGEPISARQSQFDRPKGEACVFILRRADLALRVEARTGLMIKAGLVDEVRELLARPWSKEGRAAVGYREIVDHLEGRCSLEEARQAIVRDTLRFTRRQATWFKTFADAAIVDTSDRPEETTERLLTMIQR